MNEKLERILDEKVRPYLRSHGGDVHLMEYKDGIVVLSLSGGCAGCPSADYETRAFIEDTLRTCLTQEIEVRLVHPVNQELLDYARRILGGEGIS